MFLSINTRGFLFSLYKYYLYLLKQVILILISNFYPPGALISLHRLRCSPFDVDSYYLMGCCLAAAATSALE